MASTLAEYIASQEELIKEAALALPHQFSQCTYTLGPLRQAVYLCLTCSDARGLCGACSIACHTDHEQIELFPKRNFRCDCPTSAISHPCTLHKILEDENVSNTYGQNFRGLFCRCGKPYDPKTEKETMIQCLSCEEWYHESCCNLRERLTPTEPSPAQHPENIEPLSETNDDTVSEASSSDLPPPLISGTEYECFVCGACVSKNEILKRYSGTPGAIMVIRDDPASPWRRLGDDLCVADENIDVNNGSPGFSTIGIKRALSPSDANIPDAKRVRGFSQASTRPSSLCLGPKHNSVAQAIISNRKTSPEQSLGAGDIFLTENFRERWCRCVSCLPHLEAIPYLVHPEETYEPPEDPDSGLSLEELGMRALERLPRDRAIDGIHAFNGMRDGLINYLRPFAQQGKVVNEADVRGFFASLSEAAKNRPT
ncbi:hypothetical protein L208DRAFT_1403929 [Tricholoma matsutake]|nr:hypothetical protein L208DRAFT_1403929 [Tricholoma matsutake 945]